MNRLGVAVVREEWRVVDRWWTEEPVQRRYFELVLESGQNVVVFRDEERGGWFSPARGVGGLGADGKGERGRDHQQGRHDAYEQGHGCSSFVGDICSPSTQKTPGEVRSDRPRRRR